jgi:hypothetical protein
MAKLTPALAQRYLTKIEALNGKLETLQARAAEQADELEDGDALGAAAEALEAAIDSLEEAERHLREVAERQDVRTPGPAALKSKLGL